MVIYSASSYVLLGVANLIIMSACMDYCDTIESCHGHDDTVSDRQHYIHAFNFNKSVEKHLHDLDHFKLSCKKLLEAFPLDQVDGIFVRSVKNCIFSESDPTPLKGPLRLVAVSKEVIEGMLDLDVAVSQSEDFLQYFSGGKLFPGSSPLTHRYGGHQFGYWAGQLGDGRAHLLGEYTSRKGERWELQLKGSGKTPYSRSGDGRAVVRSSVREFLCSEAMHFLGVPTSRAASLIVSEEAVWRDQFYNGKVKKERGAVVLRLATSWFRIGSLEVLAKAEELELLRKLLDFVIQEHFPSIDSNDPGKYLVDSNQVVETSRMINGNRMHLSSISSLIAKGLNTYVNKIFYSRVVNETAHLIAQWMSIGFAHGVCNTDNFSLLSITIDYGPFGFMEAYNPNFVPNTSDEEERYSIGAQANVGLFNLEKLLEALTPVLTIEQRQGAGLILKGYPHIYQMRFHKLFKAKLDLLGEDEEEDEYLIAFLLKLMEDTGADFTMTFRQLSEASMQQLHNMSNLQVMWALQNLASHKMYPEWVSMYLHRLKRQGGDSDEDRQHRMKRINPRYVLRNWMAESAIRKAEGNDFSEVELLQRTLAQPYLTQDAAEEAGYAAQPPWWAQGLNVSCSS